MKSRRNYCFLFFSAIIVAVFFAPAPTAVFAEGIVHPIYCKDPTQVFTGIKYDDNGNPEIELIVDPEFEKKFTAERNITGPLPLAPVYDLVVRVKPTINEYCLPQWDERGIKIKESGYPAALPFDTVLSLNKGILLAGTALLNKSIQMGEGPVYDWKLKGWPNGILISEKLEKIILTSQNNDPTLEIGAIVKLPGTDTRLVSRPVTFSLCAPTFGGSSHKIVIMRGKSSQIEAKYMAESSDRVRVDGFEKIQPFKKYSLASENPARQSYFAHFADLAQHDDTGWPVLLNRFFITDNYTPRRVSSCGSDGSQYFFMTGRINKVSGYAPYGTGTAFLGPGIGAITRVMHEMGHSFAGLEDEYRTGYDVTLYYANCAPPGREPHWRIADKGGSPGRDGLYFGEKISGCSVDSQYRPSTNSLMSVGFGKGFRGMGGSNNVQLNVASCGYVLQAIKRGTGSLRSFYKSELIANWQECMQMEGVVKPNILYVNPISLWKESTRQLLAAVLPVLAQSDFSSDEIVGLDFNSPYISVEAFASDGSISAEVFKSTGEGDNISWQRMESMPEDVTSASSVTTVTPTPGSTLSGSTQTFTWNPVSGSRGYVIWLGSTQGTKDLYLTNAGGSPTGLPATSGTVSNLPTDGRTLYLRVWWLPSGASRWSYKDFTYKASGTGGGTGAAAAGSVFAQVIIPIGPYDWPFERIAEGAPVISNISTEWTDSGTVRVSWTTDIPSDSTVEWGTKAQYDSDRYPFPNYRKDDALGTSHAISITGLVPNETYYYRTLSAADYLRESVYQGVIIGSGTGATTASSVTTVTPTPGSTLSGSTQTFTWNPVSGSLGYVIWLGSTQGTKDLYLTNAGGSPTGLPATSGTVSNLPTDGRTLYLRVWWLPSGASRWSYKDFTYKASGTGGGTGAAAASSVTTVTPTPGSTLSGSTQTFTWNPVSGSRGYVIWLGSTQGTKDLYLTNAGGSPTGLPATSGTVSNLPTDGRTLYLRVWWLPSGASRWSYKDFTYKAPFL